MAIEMVNATMVIVVGTVTTVDTAVNVRTATEEITDTGAIAVTEEHIVVGVEIAVGTDLEVDPATTAAACPHVTGNTEEAGEVPEPHLHEAEEGTHPDPRTDTTNKPHNDHVVTRKPNYEKKHQSLKHFFD